MFYHIAGVPSTSSGSNYSHTACSVVSAFNVRAFRWHRKYFEFNITVLCTLDIENAIIGVNVVFVVVSSEGPFIREKHE